MNQSSFSQGTSLFTSSTHSNRGLKVVVRTLQLEELCPFLCERFLSSSGCLVSSQPNWVIRLVSMVATPNVCSLLRESSCSGSGPVQVHVTSAERPFTHLGLITSV